jgi:hypothetical protein
LIDSAHQHLFTAEEIASMPTEQLRAAVNSAKRIAQAVFTATSQQKPQAEPVKPAEEDAADPFAALADAEKYDQSFVQGLLGPIKTEFAGLRAENKTLRGELETIKKATAGSQQQVLHTRLMAQLPPEVAAQIPFGSPRYAELLDEMATKQRHYKAEDEKGWLGRAIKAMGLEPVKPDPLAAKKKAWDDAATPPPTNRDAAKTRDERAVERLNEVLKGIRTKPKVNGRN